MQISGGSPAASGLLGRALLKIIEQTSYIPHWLVDMTDQNTRCWTLLVEDERPTSYCLFGHI